LGEEGLYRCFVLDALSELVASGRYRFLVGPLLVCLETREGVSRVE
jgi:hypothetical protein